VLSRLWAEWRTALRIVKPETVIAWHRRGFRLWWAWKSRRRIGRPTVPADVLSLFGRCRTQARFWGAPRILGELLKLGIAISQATVAKYMVRRRPPSPTWHTFLANHVTQVTGADFFVVPTATCRLLFVFVILAHDRRRAVHVGVTANPTARVGGATAARGVSVGRAPRYLIRDRDHAFDGLAVTAPAMAIQEVLTAPGAPWQNAYVTHYSLGDRQGDVSWANQLI
jgi:putative transposase